MGLSMKSVEIMAFRLLLWACRQLVVANLLTAASVPGGLSQSVTKKVMEVNS